MRNGERELQQDVDANGDDLDAALPGDPGRVPSQGEIGSLIAVTAAANLALVHRRSTRRRTAHHGDGTAERRSH